MTDHGRCRRVREDLAALRAGWLDMRRAAQVEEHLRSCSECSACRQHDERIALAVESLAPVRPTEVSWASVLASSSAGPRRPLLRPRSVLAMAAATVAVAVVGIKISGRLVEPVVPTQPATGFGAAPDPAAFVDAHHSLAWGAAGSDPNRAVILAGR